MKSTFTRRSQIILLLLIATAWLGCSPRQPAAVPKVGKVAIAPAKVIDCRNLPPEAVQRNDRGVGLMGQFQYKQAQEVFAGLVNEYPGCVELSVNLAIAELNASQSGVVAMPLLAKVLAANPRHARANYLSGLLNIHEQKLEEAIPFLERVAEFDPRDPYVTYHLATCYEQASRDKGIEWYRKAVDLDPLFRTPYYRLFDLSRRARQMDEALRYLEEFKKLENHPRAFVCEFKYTHMGPKADAIRLDGEVAQPLPLPKGELFSAPVPLLASTSAREWSRQNERMNVTIADLNGQGKLLVLVAGAQDGESANLVLGNISGPWSDERPHPLSRVTGVNTALWGDFDNDGLTDVYLCRRGPNQLWRQTSLNQWLDMTVSSQTAGGELNTVDGAFFDADHDGDLDLFLVNADGANELFSNNLDGTFRPLAAQSGLAGKGTGSTGVLYADLDADRDLDLIVLNAASPHDVYMNERIWVYRPATGYDRFNQSRITAVVAGDLDADGKLELYTAGDDGLTRWRPDENREWQPTVLAADELRVGQPAMTLTDVNGDGRLEILGGHQQWSVYQIEQDRASRIYSTDGLVLGAWTPAILDGARGPSVIELPGGAGEPLVRTPGPGRHPFVTIVPSGKTSGAAQERSNASGIGSRLEFRFGGQTTVLASARSQSGPGQSLQPAAIGLAGRERADYVQLQWTDGVWQTELDVAARTWHRIEETNRIPTSCPLLFAWTGERFEFVSDLLGVGGLGYFVEPGQYAPPNPAERFLLPFGRLAKRYGCYRLKLTEPMEELTYLDQARLVAYDLPPGWQMTLDERMGISAPFPTGEPRYYQRMIQPVRAVNDRGEDVTKAIVESDTVAAPPGMLDPHFIGMLSVEHVLHLTWQSPLDAQVGHPLLVADGWVEYPYSQTAFAAWQAGRRFEAPTVEARAPDGPWKTVLLNFGYPAGMPRQMSVPLANLPPGATELRVRTNQEIYWDRLVVAFAEPCPQAVRQAMQLERAELREAGFTPRVVNEQRRPFFDDTVRLPLASTRDPAGFYTALGRVDELVAQRDDALAIFGPGEEIELAFVAPAAPPRNGWRREFVLEVAGWCKDMDLYTEHGETVEPLPSRSGPSPLRDELHARFNTRYQSGR